MELNFTENAHNLLETLANSIHDREPKSDTPFFFSIKEVEVAEKWLKDFIDRLSN